MEQGPHGPEWHDSPEASQARAAAKREMLEACLARGKTQVRLDARRPGVRVPEQHVDEPALALNLSWRFAHTDMVVNERGVAATLRFGGVPFRCVLPWSAVWGMLGPDSDAVHVWPPDLPDVLGGPARGEEGEPPPVEPVRPQLAVVKPAAPSGMATEAPAEVVEATEASDAEEASDAVDRPLGEDAADAPPAEPIPASQRAPWLRLVR